MKQTVESSTLTSASFEALVREMIVRLGEDPTREGLQRTPERVHKALDFLTKGYREDPETLLKKALFTVTYDEMVIVKDVEMFSLGRSSASARFRGSLSCSPAACRSRSV
jgi:GTP cyclohydrolase IA